MAGLLYVSSASNCACDERLTIFIAIHGDKQQNERDWVLNEFKTGKSPIMVATDVASRGIGMIDRRFAFPLSCPLPVAMPCDSVWKALLSVMTCFFVSLHVPVQAYYVLFGSLSGRILDIQCRVACYALIPSQGVPQGYRGGLDFS